MCKGCLPFKTKKTHCIETGKTLKPEIKRWLWLFAGSLQHQHGIVKTEITKDKTLKCSKEKKKCCASTQETQIRALTHQVRINGMKMENGRMRHVLSKTLHTDYGTNSRQKYKETNLREILMGHSPFLGDQLLQKMIERGSLTSSWKS